MSYFDHYSFSYCWHLQNYDERNRSNKRSMGVVKRVPPSTSIEKQDGEGAANSLPLVLEELPAPGKPKPGVLALSRAAQTLSVNWLVLGFMLLFHLGAIAALFFFSWS